MRNARVENISGKNEPCQKRIKSKGGLSNMRKGDKFTIASMDYEDPYTGHIVHRLTDLKGNDRLIYFTSDSLLANDQTLIFLSDRNEGHRNLFSLNLRTREAIQLTDNQQGIFERVRDSFEKDEEVGLTNAAVSKHTGDVYYIQNRQIRCVNIHTLEESIIASEFPKEVHIVSAIPCVDENNQYLLVPTISRETFSDLKNPSVFSFDISTKVHRLGLHTVMHRFHTDGRGEEILWEEPGWVTHVQFRPKNVEWILFNHEWDPKAGIDRMWLWDGSSARRLRPEGPNEVGFPRSADDWVCHEIWQRDGEAIVYHGKYVDGPAFIGQVNLSGEKHLELSFPWHFTRYGHFAVSNDPTLLVTDGYVEKQGALLGKDRKAGGWISLIRANWKERQLSWTPLCLHGSFWNTQGAHPHPIFSHAGDKVFFNSNKDGRLAIYMVEISK